MLHEAVWEECDEQNTGPAGYLSSFPLSGFCLLFLDTSALKRLNSEKCTYTHHGYEWHGSIGLSVTVDTFVHFD